MKSFFKYIPSIYSKTVLTKVPGCNVTYIREELASIKRKLANLCPELKDSMIVLGI